MSLAAASSDSNAHDLHTQRALAEYEQLSNLLAGIAPSITRLLGGHWTQFQRVKFAKVAIMDPEGFNHCFVVTSLSARRSSQPALYPAVLSKGQDRRIAENNNWNFFQ